MNKIEILYRHSSINIPGLKYIFLLLFSLFSSTSCDYLTPLPWNIYEINWEEGESVFLLEDDINEVLDLDVAEKYDVQELHEFYKDNFHVHNHEYVINDKSDVKLEFNNDTLYLSYLVYEELIEKLWIPLDRVRSFRLSYENYIECYSLNISFRIDSLNDRRFFQEYK